MTKLLKNNMVFEINYNHFGVAYVEAESILRAITCFHSKYPENDIRSVKEILCNILLIDTPEDNK
jgi:hypothetical protein